VNGYKGPKWLDEMPGSSIAAVEVQRLMEPRPIDGDEIARKLPRGFVEAYSYLHSQALADAASLNGGRGYDETSDNRIKGGAKPPKKYGSGRAPLKSTRADGYLDTVNRKLRRIGREIKGFIEHNSPNAEMRQCSGRKCRRFADAEWLFCPWCGASTENIEGMK
jgi:hypothetical protein